MTAPRRKLLGVAALVGVTGVAIGFYVVGFLLAGPANFTARVAGTAPPTADLTLQTVAAVGPSFADTNGTPDWVSYLVRGQDGKWRHTTLWTVPAHALVRVTIYNFDGASGLRNPFLAGAQGLVGNTFGLDGRPTRVINPDDASHTFAIPELGVLVPIMGVADDAKNQCDYAPCTMSQAHHTITFTFRTGKRGRFRWQCFVPCAAGFINGFGGPMESLGYMDGFINVV